MAGLMDAMHFVNAIEHIEHTYRIMKLGYCCGSFWAFPDIANSEDYLYNPSCEFGNYASTINSQSELQQKRTKAALKHFYDIYNKSFGQFQPPSFQDI